MRSRSRDRVDGLRRTHDVRFAFFFLLGLVAIAAALYVVGYYVAGDRVPRGTTVAGVDIGGLRPAAAAARLRETLRPRLDDPIRVTAAGRTFRIDPADLRLRLDVPATVRAAGGEATLDPRHMLDEVLGGESVAPVVRADRARLRRLVAHIATTVDSAPVEPRIQLTAYGPRPHYPVPGGRLRRAAAARTIVSAYLTQSGPVRLPVRVLRPVVGSADVRAALRGFARPAVSGPVRLVFSAPGRHHGHGRHRVVTLTPRTFAPTVRMRVRHGRLVPDVDAGLLQRRAHRELRVVESDPISARVVVTAQGSLRVLHGRPGTRIDPAQLGKALVRAARRPTGHRVAHLHTGPLPPALTAAQARRLRIDRPVAAYTMTVPAGRYPTMQLQRWAHRLDGTVLLPGRVFSLNHTVGKPPRPSPRHSLRRLGPYALAERSGLSAVGTAVFNGALRAGLDIVERHAHRSYPSGYPVGRDVSVAWPGVDLRLLDRNGSATMLHATVTTIDRGRGEVARIEVQVWGSRDQRVTVTRSAPRDHVRPGVRLLRSARCRPHPGQPGFTVDLVRVVHPTGDGEPPRSQSWTTTYRPRPAVRCSSPGSGATR